MNYQEVVIEDSLLCEETDRASDTLVMDLEQRGLLDDTLVV